tara:strand:+ start:14165 stop:14590 length:426 start_codon:yes stop_codon:yes gene_type:complete
MRIDDTVKLVITTTENKMTYDQKINYVRDQGWIIDRQGKEFITFKGLLWLAHQDGLVSITSHPVKENWEERYFIFRAVVKGKKLIHNQLTDVTFEDEGDACPQNTGRMIHPHLRRMASTRAMVRALRIYTGCGLTAYEEIM